MRCLWFLWSALDSFITFPLGGENEQDASNPGADSISVGIRALTVCNHLLAFPFWEELITNYVGSLVQMVWSDGISVWTSPPTSTSDPGDHITPGNMAPDACAAAEPGGARAFGVQRKK